MPDENQHEAEDKAATDPTPPLSDPIKREHGSQVHLTGAARAAARGGLHGDIISNTIARDAAVGAGEAGDGMSVDGSTPDGHQPPDVVDGADQAKLGEPKHDEPEHGEPHN